MVYCISYYLMHYLERNTGGDVFPFPIQTFSFSYLLCLSLNFQRRGVFWGDGVHISECYSFFRF